MIVKTVYLCKASLMFTVAGELMASTKYRLDARARYTYSRPILQSSVSISGRGLQSKTRIEAV